MKWETGTADDVTTRAAARYDFAVPLTIEVSNGLFRPADRIDALLVELSDGGAAIIAPQDRRYRLKKRYRVHIDDHVGIVEIRNLVALDGAQARLGVAFLRLDLELQELVIDSLDNARHESSRLVKPSNMALPQTAELTPPPIPAELSVPPADELSPPAA